MHALIHEYIEVSANEPNFSVKYANLQSYFKQRFNLVTTFVGDDLLKDFVVKRGPEQDRRDQQAVSKETENDFFEFQQLFEAGVAQNGDAQHSSSHNHGHNHQQTDEKHTRVIKRIRQVNEEIKSGLLKEEHERKLATIERLKNEHEARQLLQQMEEAQSSGGMK